MLPVKKMSRTRKLTRRSHHALTASNTVSCPMCGQSKRPHAACENCGFVNAKVQLKRKTKEE
ncbi:MAG: 50S ribosomal protein L32 [Phycisphaerae bacterium]|nr:50S ribosomal protein L32 [Phycisphaerae bacterium]